VTEVFADPLFQALSVSFFFCVIGNGLIALANREDSLNVIDFLNFFGVELCLQGIASDSALISSVLGKYTDKLNNVTDVTFLKSDIESLQRGFALFVLQIALLVLSAVVSRFSSDKYKWLKVALSNTIGILAIGLVFFLWH